MIALLELIPRWALAAAVAALLALCGVQTTRLAWEQTSHAKDNKEHAEKIATQERTARDAVTAARDEEKRRYTALQGVVDETQVQLDRARADAAVAGDAGKRLRDRLAALATSCRSRGGGNPGTASGSPSAQETFNLLTDVQRRLDEASDGIAEFADRSHAAGSACERSYDKLTHP